MKDIHDLVIDMLDRLERRLAEIEEEEKLPGCVRSLLREVNPQGR